MLSPMEVTMFTLVCVFGYEWLMINTMKILNNNLPIDMVTMARWSEREGVWTNNCVCCNAWHCPLPTSGFCVAFDTLAQWLLLCVHFAQCTLYTQQTPMIFTNFSSFNAICNTVLSIIYGSHHARDPIHNQTRVFMFDSIALAPCCCSYQFIIHTLFMYGYSRKWIWVFHFFISEWKIENWSFYLNVIYERRRDK